MSDTLVIVRDYDLECIRAIGEDDSVHAIDEGPWDGSASNYTDAQYQKACALDRKSCGGKWADAPVKQRCSLPYKTPSGEVSRKGTHAAAQRITSVTDACSGAVNSAKAALRSAYKQLGEDPPDSIKNEDVMTPNEVRHALGMESMAHASDVETHLTLNVNLSAGVISILTAGKAWCMVPEVLESMMIHSGEIVAARSVKRSGTLVTGNGIAVIPLKGAITPQMDILEMLFGGGSGALDQFTANLREAVANPDVAKIVLDINSPGGISDQVPETAARIRQAGQVKPIVAVANTDAGSAAYWLASQAHEVAVTPSGRVGSVGVYTMHEDISKMLDRVGVKPTLISAGKYKVEGNPFEALDPEAYNARKGMVDYYYDMFTNDIASARGVSQEEVQNGYGEGRMLAGNQAVRAGLADKVATLEETVSRLSSGRSRIKRFGASSDLGSDHTSVNEDDRNGGKREFSPEEKAELLTVLAGLGV